MKLIFTLLIQVVFCLFIKTGLAQDKIILFNGKVIECALKRQLTDTVVLDKDTILHLTGFEIIKPNGKVKQLKADKVFSHLSKDSIETVFYQPDSLWDEDMTQEEAKMYIQGVMDARASYYSPVLVAGAVPAGASVIVLQWWGIPLTSGYVLFTEAFSPRVTLKRGANEKLINNEVYRLGFEKGARRKRITRVFLTGMTTLSLCTAFSHPIDQIID